MSCWDYLSGLGVVILCQKWDRFSEYASFYGFSRGVLLDCAGFGKAGELP
jgi:hypothetical protein